MFTKIEDLVQFIENSKRVTQKTDLSNMKHFLKTLGNPEQNLPIIHITGTNGKGSVVCYLDNIFRLHGMNVGCFTSPYIENFNERIRFNNVSISDADLLKYGNRVIECFPLWEKEIGVVPSFFEIVTLICFLYFKNQKSLDVLLLEVGIGGRLDSTNVVNSLLSVVTSISYDHMNLLGNTLDEILIEKLGIVKCNQNVILNLKNDHLIKVSNDYLNNLNSKAIIPDYKDLNIIKCDFEGSKFVYKDNLYDLQMIGSHQIDNALTAITVACEYFKNIKTDFCFNQVLLYKGLYNTKWLGRFEKISNEPVIFVDGAHNEDGIKQITCFLKENKKTFKLRGIVAISDNKEKETMIKMLDSVFDEIIFTKFSYSRSSVAEELFLFSKNKNKLLMVSLDEITDYIITNKIDINIFIGSLYFVSEVKKHFKK